MREEILKCLGSFPERPDNLDIVILEELDKIDYIQQLIEYTVQENERVMSYLLIPKDVKDNIPAILAIHQHAEQWHIGKSEVVGLAGDSMFAYGLDLVKKGFVVIAPDLLCFETRIRENFRANPELQRLNERFEFTKYILGGSCLQTKYLHDLSVAIDVLETLPYVDAKNIGAIGHSLGGQETVFITWYDSRIKAGVSSCGVSTVKAILEHEISHNFALYIPNLISVCDIDEVVRQISPRSIILTNGIYDEALFPLDGVKQIEDTNTNNEDFRLIRFNDGHRFNDAEKEVAYSWLIDRLC